MIEPCTQNGTLITDYERALLTILMEECAEVIQAASSLMRFGKKNLPKAEPIQGMNESVPFGNFPEPVSNSQLLALEFGIFGR